MHFARKALLVAFLGAAGSPGVAVEEVQPAPPRARPENAARSHWAFQPLLRPPVPVGDHPVDAFVRATLNEKGLEPAPPAEPGALLRRVWFDLLGLPPSPEEIDLYLRDPAPDRWERLVDRLLASPRFGERWARHWLDVARYSESQGFEYDRPRASAWPYRDYVIRAFNEDRPYDQFMREQIAGDVLEPITSDGIIAASLLVSGPYDQAGNGQANPTQRALTREEELEDLISVVGQSFLGLTINCARCHDHKFDPVSSRDYYRLKSVFDGVKHGERSTETPVETGARTLRRKALETECSAASGEIMRLEARGSELALLRGSRGGPRPAAPAPYLRFSFEGGGQPTRSGALRGEAKVARGVLELPAPGSFFESFAIDRDLTEKTLEAWVALSDLEQMGGAAVSIETLDGGTFDAIVFGERQPRKWTAGSNGFVRTRDLDAPEEGASPGAYVHLAIVYSADGTIALYRNGAPLAPPYNPGAGPVTFRAGEAHVVLGRRHKGGGRPWLTGAIREAAVHDRALSPEEVELSFRASGPGVSREEARAALPEEERFRLEALEARLSALRGEIAELDVARQAAYVGERVQPPPTHFLPRGDVKSPGEIVAPGAPASIVPAGGDLGLDPDAPEALRRLRFAAWLCQPANPLPARVMVNRLWQHHFGQGLVTTPSDFGVNGARPSHPELLDWLAQELIASGWSLKAIHRLILTSATYRQSSRLDEKAALVDADNVYLWRHAPRRLEAEAIRDAMLAASGRLNLAMGGPSFRPFTTTEFNATFYHPFDAERPDLNRRTIYRMNVVSGKDPLLDALDCPDPAVKTPRRGVTTTPLQALSLMNGDFVQRQAKALADRAFAQSPTDPGEAVQAAYRLALGRRASPAELARAVQAARDRSLASVCWALLNSTELVHVQ